MTYIFADVSCIPNGLDLDLGLDLGVDLLISVVKLYDK